MPKLLWREPVETTIITRVREDDTEVTPAVKATPAPGVTPTQPKVQVKTLGDIAGRESGALIVLLVTVGALTLASPDFLTGNNLANLA
jgi:ribose transport system permease protein